MKSPLPPPPPGLPGKWYFVVVLASLGLLAFVPFLHAAQRLHRPSLRLVAVGMLAAGVLGATLTALAPTDAEGTPTGLVANLGSIVLLGVMVVASLLVVRLRREVYDVPAEAVAPTTSSTEAGDDRIPTVAEQADRD